MALNNLCTRYCLYAKCTKSHASYLNLYFFVHLQQQLPLHAVYQWADLSVAEACYQPMSNRASRPQTLGRIRFCCEIWTYWQHMPFGTLLEHSGTLLKYRFFTFSHNGRPCREYSALSVIILFYGVCLRLQMSEYNLCFKSNTHRLQQVLMYTQAPKYCHSRQHFQTILIPNSISAGEDQVLSLLYPTSLE